VIVPLAEIGVRKLPFTTTVYVAMLSGTEKLAIKLFVPEGCAIFEKSSVELPCIDSRPTAPETVMPGSEVTARGTLQAK